MSLETGKSRFSDIERYAPSNNRLAGFLTAPLVNKLGERVGVFAIQMNLERIISQIDKTRGDDSSWAHYLVGEDGLLRTAISADKAGVLKRVIDTEQFRTWQSEHVEAVEAPDHEHETTFFYTGPGGKEVLGIHQTLEIPGVRWALISEVDRDEALAAADWLRAVILSLVGLTGLLVIGLAFYQARRITQPIIQLADVSMAVAAGAIDQKVTVKAENEIGQLADAFNHMLEVRLSDQEAIEQSQYETQKAWMNWLNRKMRWINMPLLPSLM